MTGRRVVVERENTARHGVQDSDVPVTSQINLRITRVLAVRVADKDIAIIAVLAHLVQQRVGSTAAAREYGPHFTHALELAQNIRLAERDVGCISEDVNSPWMWAHSRPARARSRPQQPCRRWPAATRVPPVSSSESCAVQGRQQHRSGHGQSAAFSRKPSQAGREAATPTRNQNQQDRGTASRSSH